MIAQLFGGQADGQVINLPDTLYVSDVIEWQELPDMPTTIADYVRESGSFAPVAPTGRKVTYRWDGTYTSNGERRYVLT
jgi:hypothetical protein